MRYIVLIFLLVAACDNDDNVDSPTEPLIPGGVTLEYDTGDQYNFGDVSTGNTETVVVTVFNRGDTLSGSMGESTGAGLIEPPFDFAGGAYPGANGTCTNTLGAGQSCTIEFSFSPTSVGDFNDDTGITYLDSSDMNPVTFLHPIELIGRGI